MGALTCQNWGPGAVLTITRMKNEAEIIISARVMKKSVKCVPSYRPHRYLTFLIIFPLLFVLVSLIFFTC